MTIEEIRKEFKEEFGEGSEWELVDTFNYDFDENMFNKLWSFIESKLKQQRAEVLEEVIKDIEDVETEFAHDGHCPCLGFIKSELKDLLSQLNTLSGDTKEVEK